MRRTDLKFRYMVQTLYQEIDNCNWQYLTRHATDRHEILRYTSGEEDDVCKVWAHLVLFEFCGPFQ